MLKNFVLLAGSAIAAFSLPTSAAATSVYTNAATFTSATGSATYGFSFASPDQVLGTSYSSGPATFSAANLIGYNDGSYGSNVSYLGAVDTSDLNVSTAASAIGFYFGSWNAPQTISYSVDGLTGTFSVPTKPDAAFLGFAGLSGSSVLTFSNNAELDTISFLAATRTPVPEPGTWAMMLVGFGALGAHLRRRQKRALAAG